MIAICRSGYWAFILLTIVKTKLDFKFDSILVH